MSQPTDSKPDAPENSPQKAFAINAKLVGLLAALCLAFAVPLFHWVKLALKSDLYSHTLLIPVVTLYLAYENRKRFLPSEPNPRLAIVPAIAGCIALALFFLGDANPSIAAQQENYLAPSILAFAFFAMAACAATLGQEAIKTNVFPLAFLVFLAPFSSDFRLGIETFFQYTSAETAYWFIKLSGVPVHRSSQLVFEMPTISMHVAPECSGIRSSFVLFIVSLVASYLFLKSPWRRTVLVLLVIPLGILRNGIRILVLAQLCYHIGPEMIHSWFHHSGGPPLFAITLAPLFVLLYLFWRSEKAKPKPTP